MQPDSLNSTDAISTIESLVLDYFKGLHFADTEKLESLFSADCVLKAPGIRKNMKEWLALVASRPVPASKGHKLDSKIMSIEVMGEQAMVKASVPLLGDHFIDYLGLLNENGKWQIVSKMYADYMPTF